MAYVHELFYFKRYAELDDHVCALYQLAQQVGRDAFVAAVDRATTQQAIGVEYVRACLALRPTVTLAPSQTHQKPPSVP